MKFSLLFLLFSLFSLLFSASAFAQETLLTPSTIETTNNQYIPSQSPHTASLAIYNFGHAMSCILIGQSPIAPCLEYRMFQDAQGMVRSVPYLNQTNTSNGLLGMSMSMLGEVIGNPPVNSSLFIADLGEQIGIKSANAQVAGSGSGVLAPIFKLWEVSRNISYLAMILIFVGVGLMVMFRQKLNPQTVVTVQMALPGLIIGLVMITFSYFLASLISDMAFVGTNLVGYYFSLAQNPPGAPAELIQPGSKEENVLTIFSRYTNAVTTEKVDSALDNIWVYLSDDAKTWITRLASLVILQTLYSTTSALRLIPGIGEGLQAVLSIGPALYSFIAEPRSIVSLFIWFIALLAIIYSMFKLLLRLINNFLSIIFLTIASPFYFLAASIPGRQSLATNWMFNMLCNVLAFPAVFAVFYFVAFLLAGIPGSPTDSLFKISTTSSLTNSSTFPLLGGLKLDFVNVLLAFGALIASPSIPDLICKAVGKPSQLGALAAGAIGGSIASGQRYSGQFSQGMGMVGERGSQLWNKPGYTQPGRKGPILKSYELGSGGQLGGISKTIMAVGSTYKGARTFISNPKGTVSKAWTSTKEKFGGGGGEGSMPS